MKLTTFIIILSLTQVSASTLAQNLSIKVTNASTISVIKQLSEKSTYLFTYDARILKQAPKVTLDIQEKSIQEILNQAFKNTKLSYTIEDRYITIIESENSIFQKAEKLVKGILQDIDIRGRVLDESGSPLPGAKVSIKGSKKSTITDLNGNFEFKGIDEKATVVIEYIGYIPFEKTAVQDLGIVTLKASNSELAEVEINAGYYQVNDKERTGSISRITGRDIARQPVNNPLASMQANVPGLQITQNTGVPGGGFTVQIRGTNSLLQGTDPFYVIDGVPFASISIAGSRSGQISRASNPLASLNPNDIESIEVLKDADATSIYGSRGANGVILITTKRGKQGTAKANISLIQGISRVAQRIDLMNTAQYISMRSEAFKNDLLTPKNTDYDVNGSWDINRNIDWQEELIGKSAPTTNILASLSGGSKNVTYLAGAAYYREATVFPGKTSFSRSSGNFSLQYTSNDKKLNMSFDNNYSQINSDLITQDLTTYIFLPPNYPPLTGEKGLIDWANNTIYFNPIADTQRPYNAKQSNVISNGQIGYLILPNLKIKASFGFTKTDRKELSSFPLATYSPLYKYGAERRYSYFTNNSINTWISESQADYSMEIGKGKLNFLVGTTFQQSLTDGQEVRAAGFNSDGLMANIAAASTFRIENSVFQKYRYTAIFSRINYNLNGRYILNITGRRDGSSRFGPGKRYANFGAIGGAWIVSDEPFFKQRLSFVNFAKLRASYGITGNDQIPNYGYLELWYQGPSYQGMPTSFPGGLANPDYAWEVNRKMEAAIELGLFDGKVNLSLGFYSNKSSNQLLFKNIPYITGFEGLTDNIPATIGNKGWELEISSKNISRKSFTWNTSFNVTIPKNKLIAYPEFESSGLTNTYTIGQPLAIRKLYNTNVDPQSGLYVVEDFDNNGLIDDKDAYVTKFIGRQFYGGIQNSMIFRDFELSFLFQFVKQLGNGHFNVHPGGFSVQSPLSNQNVELLNNWKQPGDNNLFQKFSTLGSAYTSNTNATANGEFAIENISFVRLKNLMLAYNFQERTAKKIHLKDLKIFIQGQNLFTITPYKGLDPETQTSNRLPTLQVFTGGIQLTL